MKFIGTPNCICIASNPGEATRGSIFTGLGDGTLNGGSSGVGGTGVR